MGNKRKNETDEDYKVRRSKENALQYQKRKAKKVKILAQKREKQRQYTRTHREKKRREAREAMREAPASSQGECAIIKRIEALMGDMQEQVSKLASRLEESEDCKKKLEEENAMLKAKIASSEKSSPAPQTPGKTQGC